MTKYAVFLFNDDKEGLERYTYIEDFQTNNLDHSYLKVYYCRFIENVRFDAIEINHLDMKISIRISVKTKVKFASQWTAYVKNNSGKAIVLAERIQKDEPKTDSHIVNCAYCEGTGKVLVNDDRYHETGKVRSEICVECNGTGKFSIDEIIRIDNRPDADREEEI